MTTDTTYENAVIKITELVAADGSLNDFVFKGCHIVGPAIIGLVERVQIHGGVLGGNFKAVFWEVDPSRGAVVGAIGARRCVFEDCTFMNIGFAGPPAVGQQMAAAGAQ